MDAVTSEPSSRLQVMHALREVIAALDRRVPQGQRADAGAIARDSHSLRQEAVGRLAMLERESDLAAHVQGRGALAPPAKD